MLYFYCITTKFHFNFLKRKFDNRNLNKYLGSFFLELIAKFE